VNSKEDTAPTQGDQTGPAIFESLLESRLPCSTAATVSAFDRRRLSLLLAGLALVLGGFTTSALNYVITDLSAASGIANYPFAINSAGVVVGTYRPSTNIDIGDHAFKYSGGTITDLGTLRGDLSLGVFAGPAFSTANGINDSGLIAGDSGTTNVAAYEAFLYDGTNMTALGTLNHNLGLSYGYAINAAGTVVGRTSTTNQQAFHAYSYANGSMTDLGTLDNGNSSANAINTPGVIAGSSSYSIGGANHAIIYKNGIMTDLGTLPGFRDGAAYGINDVGIVVGYAYNAVLPHPTHAFIWQGGVMTDLGTLGGTNSHANGISNDGTIVGDADTVSGETHAFVKSPDGVMEDLNDDIPPNSGWVLTLARAINASGQIVGYGTNPQGLVNTGFLLTPVPTTPRADPDGTLHYTEGSRPVVIEFRTDLADTAPWKTYYETGTNSPGTLVKLPLTGAAGFYRVRYQSP
jgi:probable HAF family extracellular repeat protein